MFLYGRFDELVLDYYALRAIWAMVDETFDEIHVKAGGIDCAGAAGTGLRC